MDVMEIVVWCIVAVCLTFFIMFSFPKLSDKLLGKEKEVQEIVDRILEVIEDYKKFYQIKENSGLREGQVVFNACYEMWPDQVNELRATEYDCFYYDDRRKVDIFIDVLAKHIYDSRSK